MERIRDVFHYLGEFNTVTVILRILLAVIAGGIIGNERGRHGRAAGFRTHILVCLGGAMTSLCGLYVSKIAGMGGRRLPDPRAGDLRHRLPGRRYHPGPE